jgi:hypothetical protein
MSWSLHPADPFWLIQIPSLDTSHLPRLQILADDAIPEHAIATVKGSALDLDGPPGARTMKSVTLTVDSPDSQTISPMSATRRTMLVGMASKRTLLELLSRDELLAAVDLFGIDVPDRRAKDGIVNAMVASRKVSVVQPLADFPRHRLKDLCRPLGLDDAGPGETALIDRLTSASAAAAGNGNSARAAAAGSGNGPAAARPRTNGKQAAATLSAFAVPLRVLAADGVFCDSANMPCGGKTI